MATVPAAFTQFGYTLALAERTLSAVLRQHLAERGVVPETWYALQLVATRGPALDREALSADLAGSRTLDADSTRELLARLEAEGLIRGGREVDLTDAGRRLHRSLAEHIAIPRDRLLSQSDPADIETTVRTLREITERALA
jgi:DNA-binding MarR family transcriptional regulator